MRTRLIRPEFFTDEVMAGASIPTRFVYIGLWTLCDDAGYFERKPRQMAAALFPYETPTRRERTVDAALEELVRLDRVVYLDCGSHGRVPTLPRHGAKGGNKSETFRLRHLAVCQVRTPDALVRTSTYESSSVLGSGSGSVLVRVEEGASAGEMNRPRSLPPFESMIGGKTA